MRNKSQLVRNDQRAEPTSVSCGIQLRCTVGTEFDVGDLTVQLQRLEAKTMSVEETSGKRLPLRPDQHKKYHTLAR